jgi:hydroxyacylglutathione hydrolase
MGFEKIFENVYLLKNQASCNVFFLDFEKKILIDTGHFLTFKTLLKALEQSDFNIKKINYILCTHSHGDHVGCVSALKSLNPQIKIAGSTRYKEYQNKRKERDIPPGAEDQFDEYELDIPLKENDEINLGNQSLKVYETTGHTRDSVSFFLETESLLFSGDVIYDGIVTQLDYYQPLELSLEELSGTYEKIFKIHAKCFLPGHGPLITDPEKTLKQCGNKMLRLKNNFEMLIINTFIPVTEFYIYKNPGIKKEEVINFFVKNKEKFKNDPGIEKISDKQFIFIIEKLISLMGLMKMVKEESGKLFLKNEINANL